MIISFSYYGFFFFFTLFLYLTLAFSSGVDVQRRSAARLACEGIFIPQPSLSEKSKKSKFQNFVTPFRILNLHLTCFAFFFLLERVVRSKSKETGTPLTEKESMEAKFESLMIKQSDYT